MEKNVLYYYKIIDIKNAKFNFSDALKGEINFNLNGEQFFAVAEKVDIYIAIDHAKDEIIREITSQKKKLNKTIKEMTQAGIPVSLFIDPDPDQIKASCDIGATFVEIHTGRYCDARSETERDKEFDLIATAAEVAREHGLRVNAGHGLDYRTTARIAALGTIEELSIGHAIIARAALVGLEKAVREMYDIVRSAGNHQY